MIKDILGFIDRALNNWERELKLRESPRVTLPLEQQNAQNQLKHEQASYTAQRENEENTSEERTSVESVQEEAVGGMEFSLLNCQKGLEVVRKAIEAGSLKGMEADGEKKRAEGKYRQALKKYLQDAYEDGRLKEYSNSRRFAIPTLYQMYLDVKNADTAPALKTVKPVETATENAEPEKVKEADVKPVQEAPKEGLVVTRDDMETVGYKYLKLRGRAAWIELVSKNCTYLSPDGMNPIPLVDIRLANPKDFSKLRKAVFLDLGLDPDAPTHALMTILPPVKEG